MRVDVDRTIEHPVMGTVIVSVSYDQVYRITEGAVFMNWHDRQYEFRQIVPSGPPGMEEREWAINYMLEAAEEAFLRMLEDSHV